MPETTTEIEFVNGPLDGHRKILPKSQQQVEDVLFVPIVRETKGKPSRRSRGNRKPVVRNAIYGWASTYVQADRPLHRVERYVFQRMGRGVVREEPRGDESSEETQPLSSVLCAR